MEGTKTIITNKIVRKPSDKGYVGIAGGYLAPFGVSPPMAHNGRGQAPPYGTANENDSHFVGLDGTNPFPTVNKRSTVRGKEYSRTFIKH
jgi:hypothetical protein